MAHDVRAVANFVLDCADEAQIGVSNLALNKILYFLHVAFLHHFDRPLVSAKIEAWDHGPVFREVYHQFKVYGRDNIRQRARKIDFLSGEYSSAVYSFEGEELSFAQDQCRRLLRVPAGKLVDLSHIEDGAWYKARYRDGRVNPGVEITNELIREAGTGFARH